MTGLEDRIVLVTDDPAYRQADQNDPPRDVPPEKRSFVDPTYRAGAADRPWAADAAYFNPPT